MIRQPKKVSLLLISLLCLLCSIICLSSCNIFPIGTFGLISATEYAIDDTDNYGKSGTVVDKELDEFSSDANISIAEGSQETTPSVFVDSNQLIPEDPPIQEGESPSKIIVAELQDKTGVPEIYDDGMFRYYLVDGAYYEVAGIYKSCFDKIEIPSELFGVPVKGIQSNAFRQYKYLVSVVIPDSIEYIGDYAFHNCPNLTSVSLPKSEIKIGKGVFQMSE